MDTACGIRGNRVPPLTIDEIKRYYEDGNSVSWIARALKMNRKTIAGAMRIAGIWKPCTNRTSRVYKVDELAFSRRTPEAKYWIGFLFADGYLPRSCGIRLSLAARDRDHVAKFMKFMGSNSPIVDSVAISSSVSDSKPFPVASGFVYSTTAAKYLIDAGMTQPSKNRVAAEWLASSVDFWRGVIDGDGMLGMYRDNDEAAFTARLNLIASAPMIAQYRKFISYSIGYEPRLVDTPYPMMTAICNGKQAAIAMGFLYSDASTALTRKAIKAREILTYYAVKPPENRYKTHCSRGHEFTNKNTRLHSRKDRKGRVERGCKACARIHDVTSKRNKRRNRGINPE